MDMKLVTLTDGSIKNTYLRTTSFDDFLPADVIGGRNGTQGAPRVMSIDFGGGLTSHTDIDGVKKMLRDRQTVSAFMQRHHLKAGDQLCVVRTGAYSLHISVV